MKKVKFKNGKFNSALIFLLVCLLLSCPSDTQLTNTKHSQEGFYQIVPMSLNLLGEGDIEKLSTVKIEDIRKLKNPDLVVLLRGLDTKGEAYVDVNGNRYDIPPITGGLRGKIVIPLSSEHLKNGDNEIKYFKTFTKDGYRILDSRIESVEEKSTRVIGWTYQMLARSIPETITAFDFVTSYKGEGKRKESDVPMWTQRGKVRIIRLQFGQLPLSWKQPLSGSEYEDVFIHLYDKYSDRLIEICKEGHFNAAMIVWSYGFSLPYEKKNEQICKVLVKKFHNNGIKVTAYISATRIQWAPNEMYRDEPEMFRVESESKNWINRNEYGEPRWYRKDRKFRSYLADLKNEEWIKYQLKRAELAIDAGFDELYYDNNQAETGDLIRFFLEVRELLKKKGKNLSIYCNCKGDFLVDGVCDINKSEGLRKPEVVDGKLINNIGQARFYYASGDGWKPYRSKGGIRVETLLTEEKESGWKRPIAEANAFQAHYAVSEYGQFIQHWILKDDKKALKHLNDICQYNKFLEENEEFYTDVTTVSKVGILAPLDYRWEREFFNALGEMNVMYNVLLLPRIDTNTLTKYETIVIPNIPYVNESQLKVIEDYKKGGGKIYTIGSSEDLKRLATTYSPSSVCQEIEKETIREEFLNNLKKLLPGEPLININGTKYVTTNVVKKKGTDRIILHFINYSEPVENVKVNVNLEGFVSKIDRDNIHLLSPDNVPKEIKNLTICGYKVEFSMPKLDIYNIVVIN
jgi:hypothetical protein